MSKAKTTTDLLPEYDFRKADRGKYYEQFRRSSNVVVLDPDVAKAFPNSEAVNQALRTLAERTKKRQPRQVTGARKRRPNNEMKLTKPAKR